MAFIYIYIYIYNHCPMIKWHGFPWGPTSSPWSMWRCQLHGRSFFFFQGETTLHSGWIDSDISFSFFLHIFTPLFFVLHLVPDRDLFGGMTEVAHNSPWCRMDQHDEHPQKPIESDKQSQSGVQSEIGGKIEASHVFKYFFQETVVFLHLSGEGC